MVNEKIRQVFALAREDIYFILIIIMLGVTMYWSAIIVNPILEIAENQHQLAKIAISQNERIIQMLSNGTDKTTQDLIIKSLEKN